HEHVIAVAPFHVEPSDASASYVREGLLEVLSSRIAVADGKRAADPSRVLRAAPAAGYVAESETPPSVADAIRLARALNADEIVAGSIKPASGGMIAVSASLVDVASSSLQTTMRVVGPPDSLSALADQLIAGLVLPEVGEKVSSLAPPLRVSPAAL